MLLWVSGFVRVVGTCMQKGSPRQRNSATLIGMQMGDYLKPRVLWGSDHTIQNMYLKVKCHQGAQTLPPIEVFQLRKR